MLHDLLSDYLKAIEKTLTELDDAQIEQYRKELFTPQRLNLKIRIRFNNGHLLELSEAVENETGRLKHLSYRYHLQDGSNQLVFRYDNTPHFPTLDSFPHHKHLQNGVIASQKPSLFYVLEEAKRIINSSGYA